MNPAIAGFKFKEGGNIALTLHFVQPQEYIEYFED